MSERASLSGRAAELRGAFDRSFAAAPRVAAAMTEDLLAIRVAGEPYALRLAECAGLFVDRRVTPVPTPVPELLGLAGFRTSLVPVYDLAALLGYPPGRAPRWMVSAAGVAVVAVAFEHFEAHLRVARDAIVPGEAPPYRHADDVVRLPDGTRPVLRLLSVIEAIEARATSHR